MYTKTILVGRLTKDPVARSYGNDNGVMSLFTVATDSGKDKTTFNDCIAFGKTADNINKYFKKGRPILVEGTFQNNNTERDVNGTKVTNYGMNLVVDRWSFVGAPEDSAVTTQTSAPKQSTKAPVTDPFGGGFGGFGPMDISDDDVPF